MRAISIIARLVRDQRGATAVEYGLIISMIVLGMLAALRMLATESVGLWTRVSDAFSAIVGS